MKRNYGWILCAGLLLFSGAGFCKETPVKTQVPAPESSKMSPEQEAMMARWMEFATPGEGHKVLEPLIGKWDYTMEWWMAPGADAEKSEGTSEIQWILGGRYTQQKVSGLSKGQKFEGMGIVGYDNFKKEYNSLWMDTIGTGFTSAVGSYDPAAKTLTEKGSYTDPAQGGPKNFRAVTTLVDPDHYTYEMYIPGPDASEFRSLRISYKRNPKPAPKPVKEKKRN